MFLIASYHNDVSLRLIDCSAVPQVIASKTEFFFTTNETEDIIWLHSNLSSF